VKKYLLAIGILCALFTVAEARPKQTHQVHPECNVTMPCEGVVISERGQRVILARRGFGSPVKTYTPPNIVSSHAGIGPRPSRWCGWYMQQETGVTSRGTGLNLNRAVEWARVGRPSAPVAGAIVVWRHHVGVLVAPAERGLWIVRSGNDGHAVRTRTRAISAAVAFRAL
jgi:hypothetical protein